MSSSLPNEVLAYVLRWFDRRTLELLLRFVSKRFNALVSKCMSEQPYLVVDKIVIESIGDYLYRLSLEFHRPDWKRSDVLMPITPPMEVFEAQVIPRYVTCQIMKLNLWEEVNLPKREETEEDRARWDELSVETSTFSETLETQSYRSEDSTQSDRSGSNSTQSDILDGEDGTQDSEDSSQSVSETDVHTLRFRCDDKMLIYSFRIPYPNQENFVETTVREIASRRWGFAAEYRFHNFGSPNYYGFDDLSSSKWISNCMYFDCNYDGPDVYENNSEPSPGIIALMKWLTDGEAATLRHLFLRYYYEMDAESVLITPLIDQLVSDDRRRSYHLIFHTEGSLPRQRMVISRRNGDAVSVRIYTDEDHEFQTIVILRKAFVGIDDVCDSCLFYRMKTFDTVDNMSEYVESSEEILIY